MTLGKHRAITDSRKVIATATNIAKPITLQDLGCPYVSVCLRPASRQGRHWCYFLRNVGLHSPVTEQLFLFYFCIFSHLSVHLFAPFGTPKGNIKPTKIALLLDLSAKSYHIQERKKNQQPCRCCRGDSHS